MVANRTDEVLFVNLWCTVRGDDGLIEREQRGTTYSLINFVEPGHRSPVHGPDVWPAVDPFCDGVVEIDVEPGDPETNYGSPIVLFEMPPDEWFTSSPLPVLHRRDGDTATEPR